MKYRLTENRLRDIIREAVKNTLNENDFGQRYNNARDNYDRALWGFEMKNSEGEWEYGEVKYDPSSQTMSCMGATINVDPEMSVDANLEALYEKLMENGYTDE